MALHPTAIIKTGNDHQLDNCSLIHRNIGEFKGQKVEDAKDLVREMLFAKNHAFRYAEPERKVTSRSGDDCIVAWMDQWYLDYGEESWKNEALGHVANVGGKGLETYSDE